jgi:hypothetical protein
MPKPPPFHAVRSTVRDRTICIDATATSRTGATIFMV